MRKDEEKEKFTRIISVVSTFIGNILSLPTLFKHSSTPSKYNTFLLKDMFRHILLCLNDVCYIVVEILCNPCILINKKIKKERGITMMVFLKGTLTDNTSFKLLQYRKTNCHKSYSNKNYKKSYYSPGEFIKDLK